MPGTFSDSWKLTKTAFRLIAEDRALLVFPLVGGLAILAVLVLFVVGTFFLFPQVLSGGATTADDAAVVGLFVVTYFVCSFVSVYATAGLVGAATQKLEGRQPTAADGWRVARGRLGRLVAWSLVTATVGLVIQLIASRVRGIAGSLIGLAGGAAWSVVTYFIIPVLLYEETATWPSLKRSGHLFISNFGRTLVSNVVVGLIVGLGVFAAFVLGILGIWSLVGGATVVGVGLIAAALAVGAVFALIGSAAEGILRAALYRYATTGKIDPDLLPNGYRLPPGGPSNAPLP